MSRSIGFVELLMRSAEVLEAEAAALKESHTRPSTGRWVGDYATAKAAHDEMLFLAKHLRKSAQSGREFIRP